MSNYKVEAGSLYYAKGTPFTNLGLKIDNDFELDLSLGIIGLCGHTGSGKSTFLSLLAGEHLNEGINVFLDSEIAKPPKIGFVLQQPEDQLFCQTVSEELDFAHFNFYKQGLAEIEKIKLLKLMGFKNAKELLKRDPLLLSGGEKRRIAIASILSMKPKVLLLDEPFSGIDPITIRCLIKSFKQLVKEGIAIIYAGHEIFEMFLISHKILIFQNSGILAMGEPKMMANEIYNFSGVKDFLDYSNTKEQKYLDSIWRKACI